VLERDLIQAGQVPLSIHPGRKVREAAALAQWTAGAAVEL